METFRYTVYARYALMILAGYLAAGDIIPASVATALAQDPEVVDLMASAITGLVAFFWYHVSKAKKALNLAPEA